NNAFVGFTGGTGGSTSTQQISSFSFTESLSPATYPNAVTVNAGKTGFINVLAPGAPSLNGVTMGTLTLGSGSSLNVGADAAERTVVQLAFRRTEPVRDAHLRRGQQRHGHRNAQPRRARRRRHGPDDHQGRLGHPDRERCRRQFG